MRDFSGVAGASGAQAVNGTRWTPEVGNAIVQEIANVIRSAEGGGAALDPGDNTQLLQALLNMIGGGITTPDTQTIVIGDWVIKRGSHRSAVTSEATRSIAFDTPFPTSCEQVMVTGAITFAGINRDLWVQLIDGSTSAGGFGVQYQGVDDSSPGAAGFDWVAFGR